MSGALTGRRILVPRAGVWGSRVSALCEARGAAAVIAPIIETRPPNDLAALARFTAALGTGQYSWLFITSAASVDVLREHSVAVPASTAIAAVGEATRRALEDAGYSVAFMPAGASSSQALVEQWKLGHQETTGRDLLVMRSDLAPATVSDELTLAGHSVDVCIAYRTVGIDLSAEIRREDRGLVRRRARDVPQRRDGAVTTTRHLPLSDPVRVPRARNRPRGRATRLVTDRDGDGADDRRPA